MIHAFSNFRRSIPDINSWLFAALFFCIPIKVAPAYNISALILVLWLIEGDFKKKWQQLKGNSIFWIFQAYFWIFVLSLLWTENFKEGQRMVLRNTFFLLSPVFLTVARKEHFDRYIHAFLASIAMCELLAYYNFIRLHYLPQLPAGIMVKKSLGDTAPFVDRILYTPALAFAGYLAAYRAITVKDNYVRKIIYFILFVLTVGNLVFSGGRTGQLAFVVLMALLAMQRFSKRPWLGIFSAAIFSAIFFLFAYTLNSNFKERTDRATFELIHYKEMAGKQSMNSSSVGLRLTFWTNSAQIFLEHPILGVGGGDFEKSYIEINQRLTPLVDKTHNPHNQYLFVVATVGIFGGVILFVVLIPPGFWARKRSDFPEMKSALVILFVFICILESYLWRSNTSLMYVVFSSLLYSKDRTSVINKDS